jgi:hypothetical protein
MAAVRLCPSSVHTSAEQLQIVKGDSSEVKRGWKNAGRSTGAQYEGINVDCWRGGYTVKKGCY